MPENGVQMVGPGESPPLDSESRYYTRPTEQLDYERRRAEEAGEDHPLSSTPGKARNFAVEGNDTSDYVGVSQEYMTYAEETHKPLRSQEGPDQMAEERILDSENFAYAGEQPPREDVKELGQGSYGEHVLPGTSGENVSGLRVDTEQQPDQGLAEVDDSTRQREEAKRAAAPKTSVTEKPARGTDKESATVGSSEILRGGTK